MDYSNRDFYDTAFQLQVESADDDRDKEDDSKKDNK